LGANFENLEVHAVAHQISHASGNQLDNVITCFGRALISVDGGAGDDTLLGGSGMEEFDYTDPSGNYGHDVVDGGETGNARFVFGNLGVAFDFRNGTAHGEGPSGDWSIVFTNVGGARSGAGDDLLIANNAGLHFVSGAGNDTLRGGRGDDLLYAEEGNDLIRTGGGDDKLIGGTGADVLQGGAGDDDLLGHFGVDVLKGGAGNDHFEWWAGDNDRRVNGGSGKDTLGMSYGPMHLDLTAIPDSRFVNIENIDMSVVRNTLTLAGQDVLAISSTDTLRVFGSSDDTVDIAGRFTDLGVSGNFHRYQIGAATLLVDTDITDVG
jgi:Ca2+-binding RTX toxin-like protein